MAYLMPNKPVSSAVALRERHSLSTLSADELRLMQARAAEVQKAKRAQWATLDLRQTWADDVWMHGFLTRAGVRIGNDLEPATPQRLRVMLRRAGLTGEQWTDALGCSLARFLELNPRLPLWAASALVLEFSGAFEPS